MKTYRHLMKRVMTKDNIRDAIEEVERNHDSKNTLFMLIICIY